MPVFPILRSKVHIFCGFLKNLRSRGSARLQLLEAMGGACNGTANTKKKTGKLNVHNPPSPPSPPASPNPPYPP